MQHGLLDAASLQQMLYQALDGSDDLVLVLEQTHDGPDGLVIAAGNDAFCRVAGYTTADLVGTPFTALAAPGSAADTWTQAAQSVRDQRSFRSELLCARPTGAPFWLGFHLMPVPHSKRPCCVLLGRDITASLRDREQHAAIQGLLAKVFVSVQAAVAIIDERGVIMMTNPAFDSLLLYPAGSLVGKPSMDLAAPSCRQTLTQARDRQIATGENYALEALALRADGSELPVKLASILVEREDLKRFRILTLTAQPRPAAAPVTVHIAGKIKLIGMEDIKASLGARWAGAAERAMATAEHIVKRHCGPRDSWSRTTDSGFVISFGDTTEAAAALRAAAIAREIRTRLIGDGEASEAACVSAVTAVVDLPDQPGRSPDMLAQALAQRLTARMAEIEQNARETLRHAVRDMACELGAIRVRRTLEIVGHFASLPTALDERMQRALAVLPGAEREAFEVDRLVLGAAAEHVIESIATGGSAPLFVAVDFEMFLDRRCTERYLAACRTLDARLRQYLVLVLTHLPRGVPRNRLLECVMRLRPFCHQVAFEADGMDLPPLEPTLLSGSIVIVRAADTSRWSIEDLAKLDRLGGLVRAQRARLLVRHLGSWSHAKRLLKLDVDLIGLANDSSERDARIRELAQV